MTRNLRSVIVSAVGVLVSTLSLSGCTMGTFPATPADSPVAGVRCTDPESLFEQLRLGTRDEATTRLGQTDDWLQQLSAFERSARRRTLDSTSTAELLDHLARQGLSWSSEEEVYWTQLVQELSEVMAGFSLDIPDAVLVKTTGLDEFGFAYARSNMIAIPADRVAISGDRRRDFHLLAHEVFHLISWNQEMLMDELYALLGFERFDGLDPPASFEYRRFSNPAAHTYDHTLEVMTSDGPKRVIPSMRARVPLAEVIEAPSEGQPSVAFLPLIRFFLVPVDPSTSRPEMRNGKIRSLDFDETDWRQRLQRNTSFVIHPNEIVADNFASLMEWRSSNIAPTDNPSGFEISDLQLLSEIERVLSRGCSSD